jgi:CBS domain containing-hemolysin-like protein
MDLILTLFLIALNGFFVAAEFALVKVRISQLSGEIKAGKKSALIAQKILASLDTYLSGCQLGITLTSLALGAIGEPMVERFIHDNFHFLPKNLVEPISYVIALLTLTIFHVVLGEQAPKILALQKAKNTTLNISYPLYFFYLVFKPAIWGLDKLSNITLKLIGLHPSGHGDIHTAEELRFLIDQSAEAGNIGQEHEIIQNAFDFKQKKVNQIMKPSTSIISFDVNDNDLKNKIISEGYSRVPVYSESPNNIVGVLYLKDVIKSKDIKDSIKPVYFVPENKKISDLLKELQKEKLHMSIVVDEYGLITGLVTIEDILEELVGEIQDEHDDESPIVKQLSTNEWLVNASATIDDVNLSLPKPLPQKPSYETVNGFILSVLERIPQENDTFQTTDWNITIQKKKGPSVQSIKMSLNN